MLITFVKKTAHTERGRNPLHTTHTWYHTITETEPRYWRKCVDCL